MVLVWQNRVKHLVSGISAVVKAVDSHLCAWGSIPGKSCSFLIVSLNKSLSLRFMCSDQHVKYQMPRGVPLPSSLLLDFHNTHTFKDSTSSMQSQTNCSLNHTSLPFSTPVLGIMMMIIIILLGIISLKLCNEKWE